MDQLAQPRRRWLHPVFEDAAQEVTRAPPLIALQAEQDRGLVRKILIERADAHPGPLRHPRRGETLRALLGQDLNSSIENGRDQLAGAGLLRLFS
ncbi:hypothetical protein GGD64_001084 [Bradyrhizobium sp. CIR3A]|nr:hypothetical protein [Bradyrhizobium sp. CIR3A]